MILGVAIKLESSVIRLPKPNRHSDCFKIAVEQGANISFAGKPANQGFYTETSGFLTREEAMSLVKTQGIDLIPDWQTGQVNVGKALFSEDLW